MRDIGYNTGYALIVVTFIICFMLISIFDEDSADTLEVKCKSTEEVIMLHEKRTYFIDKLNYPTKELSKKEIKNLRDSITKYNKLLK